MSDTMKTERPPLPRQLEGLRAISWIFDELIRIPGTRFKFGLDALLGILPGGGDMLGGAVSAYALIVARRMGAPPAVILRMALNIVVDALVGVVPLAGDLFDAGWKANRRNLALLERYAGAPVPTRRSSLGVVALAIGIVLAAIVGLGAVSIWLISLVF